MNCFTMHLCIQVNNGGGGFFFVLDTCWLKLKWVRQDGIDDFCVLYFVIHRPYMFEVPYTFNIHESPVTCTQFYCDCPVDFLKALNSATVSRTRKRQLQRDCSSQVNKS